MAADMRPHGGGQSIIRLRPRPTATADEPVLIRIEQAAKRLNVSRRTLARWVQAGEVPHVRLGDALLRFPVALLDEWWERRVEGGR